MQPLVATLFANGKATCFAYGQTGSGKTYTMSPLPIRAAADLLQYLALPQWSDVGLYVSCFEIYGNKVGRGRSKLGRPLSGWPEVRRIRCARSIPRAAQQVVGQQHAKDTVWGLLRDAQHRVAVSAAVPTRCLTCSTVGRSSTSWRTGRNRSASSGSR